MNQHQKYITRCIELAKRGMGNVAPNPLVGAVLVHDDKIIGEGWHEQFGKAHAEVNCISSVLNENKKHIQYSTLYVSLEPCNHFGKTPACTELIIQSGIKKVVIGCRDENKLVNGIGVKRLIDAGIEVIENVLEENCKKLNQSFFTFHKLNRPYVIFKWAQTNDKFIAGENFEQIKISNNQVDYLMHQRRAAEAAIMVGFNTAFYDNPKLTTRNFENLKQPLRIVIDKQCKLPSTHFLLADNFPTLILNELLNKKEGEKEFVKLDFKTNWLNGLMQILFDKKIISVIIEGGRKLLQSFIESNLWDEAIIITNKEINQKNGISSPKLIYSNSRNIEVGNNVIEVIENKKQ